MQDQSRIEVIAVIWGTMACALFGLFISAAATDGFTFLHFLAMVVLLAVPLTATGAIWRWGAGLTSAWVDYAEKAKRDRITQALRNLSTADLERLKERLANDDIDDAALYAYLTADTERARITAVDD